jgi:hypothetical protein
MNAERWRQVDRLYHSALEREPDERAAFLAEACQGDEELRREVDELLAQDSSSDREAGFESFQPPREIPVIFVFIARLVSASDRAQILLDDFSPHDFSLPSACLRGPWYHRSLKRGANAFLFAVLSVFFLGTTLVWLLLDRSAPTWDDAIYLTKSLAMVDALADRGLLGYARTFLTVMDLKPPLIAALPTAIYLIVGRHPRAACAVNLLFMLLLFAAVFRIARKFSSARAGLLAVYIVATMPMVYGLSRWYLVECSLTATVAIAIYVLCESDQMANAWKILALGFLCAAGLLLKFSFPLYLLVPFLYYAITSGWRVLRWKTVLLLTIPVIVLAAPWYLLHFRRALEVALFTGSAESAVLYSQTHEVYSFAILRDYLTRIFNAGPAIYFAALPVLLVLVWGILPPAARAGLRLCALWASPVFFLLMWRGGNGTWIGFAPASSPFCPTSPRRVGCWLAAGCPTTCCNKAARSASRANCQ